MLSVAIVTWYYLFIMYNFVPAGGAVGPHVANVLVEGTAAVLSPVWSAGVIMPLATVITSKNSLRLI